MRRPFLIHAVLVCLVASTLVSSAPPQPAPAPVIVPAPAGPVAPDAMHDISFDGLTADQQKLAVSLLNDNGCDCGCGMKVAVCRRDDAKCGRSKDLATQVVAAVKAGKGKDDIVKAILTPPSKFVQFPLTAGDAPAIGPKNAKVTILHYFDYQCPFCSKVAPTIDQIAKDYSDSVRIVYKMHPLSMHPNAMPAAEAAMAAKAQGKFIEMHRKLFENQQALSRDKYIAIAKEIGLNVDKFTKDIDNHTYAEAIQKEAKEVEDLGAGGTPASFINGRFLNGAKPYASFKDMIDEELGWAKAGNRPEFKTGKNIAEASAKQPGSAGPDPNKVYPLTAGKSPSRGPASAKVTILHYLDYQ